MTTRLTLALLFLAASLAAPPAAATEGCVDDGTTLACVVVDERAGEAERGLYLYDWKTGTTAYATTGSTNATSGNTSVTEVSLRALGGAQSLSVTATFVDAAHDGRPERGGVAFATWSAGGAPRLAAELRFADTDGDGRPDPDGLSWRVEPILP